MNRSTLSYTERSHYCSSSLGKRLLALMDVKQTNLALSADVTSANQLIALADELGPEICMLKTHIDIIRDFTPALTEQLIGLARKHDFILFEDRKFADIGYTVKHQYEGGMYKIANWADVINAHSLPGLSIVQGLAEIGRKKNRGLILIAELSSMNHLMTQDYMQKTLQLAKEFPDFVLGFITQHALSCDPQWIYMTPGVKLDGSQDHLGQCYISPEKAIQENGTDIIIVGRGIVAAEAPLKEAQRYKTRAWQAYLNRK